LETRGLVATPQCGGLITAGEELRLALKQISSIDRMITRETGACQQEKFVNNNRLADSANVLYNKWIRKENELCAKSK
jgi:hypothetical protein